MRRESVSGSEAQIADSLIFAVLLLSADVIVGFVAGLLGVGGGIVVVPILFQTFAWFDIDENVRMHMATREIR